MSVKAVNLSTGKINENVAAKAYVENKDQILEMVSNLDGRSYSKEFGLGFKNSGPTLTA